MALISVSVKQEGWRKFSATTKLFQSKRVVYYYQDTTDETYFFYDETDGRSESPMKYKYDGTRVAFQALLDEGGENQFLVLNVTSWRPQIKTKYGEGNYRERPATRIGINQDYIYKVEADSNSSSYSHIFLCNGNFGTIKIKVPYTLDGIDQAGSGSGSL